MRYSMMIVVVVVVVVITGVPRGGVWGVQPPPPEILKISVESLIA